MTVSGYRPSRWQFGLFEIDIFAKQLLRRGVIVHLERHPLVILLALLEQPGEAMSRAELQRRLWEEGTHVDFEAGLNTAIRKLRHALGDSAETPRYIETVPRSGYRFIAPVKASRSGRLEVSNAEGLTGSASLAYKEDLTAISDQMFSSSSSHGKMRRAGLIVAVVLIGGIFLWRQTTRREDMPFR